MNKKGLDAKEEALKPFYSIKVKFRQERTSRSTFKNKQESSIFQPKCLRPENKINRSHESKHGKCLRGVYQHQCKKETRSHFGGKAKKSQGEHEVHYKERRTSPKHSPNTKDQQQDSIPEASNT